jgi:dolichol kinase
MVSIIPAVLASRWSGEINLRHFTLDQPLRTPTSEINASLYALHAALLPVLYSITTTSLCPAELQLLSISLLNLLLLSASPSSRILAIILWVGGLGLLLLCSPIIRWGVTLARVPRWRFRRAARVVQARQSFMRGLWESVRRKHGGARKGNPTPEIVPSDADDDFGGGEAAVTTNGNAPKPTPLNLESIQSFVRNLLPDKDAARSAVEWRGGADPFATHNGTTKPEKRRRNTLPASVAAPDTPDKAGGKRRRPRGLPISYFLSLTPAEAARRRWLYAGYLYLIMAILILGPIRALVSRWALRGHEPFGWAVGYLGGDLRDLRFQIVSSGLDGWIPLPPLRESCASGRDAGWPIRLRDSVIGGPANARLLIAAYAAFVLTFGLLAVHRLASLVEVDTRRKVFHGVMVAMLLPTAPLDPPFLALALALVLCVFLLLDLLRASQLPPLSRPLASFLAPFVDGRDLRGPVVVSHIFLLIGCAVPLWLGVAGVRLGGAEPWAGWSVAGPSSSSSSSSSPSSPAAPAGGAGADLSMVAGVVCVGLGDAAASLVGRRWGRRRWAWSGGKSLEGSAAFALAVVAGLAFGKAEFAILSPGSAPLLDRVLGGGGDGLDLAAGVAAAGAAALRWSARVWAAAAAASLMEAVLTGGNDNVVVPVVLWLYVRALGV